MQSALPPPPPLESIRVREPRGPLAGAYSLRWPLAAGDWVHRPALAATMIASPTFHAFLHDTLSKTSHAAYCATTTPNHSCTHCVPSYCFLFPVVSHLQLIRGGSEPPTTQCRVSRRPSLSHSSAVHAQYLAPGPPTGSSAHNGSAPLAAARREPPLCNCVMCVIYCGDHASNVIGQNNRRGK